MRLIMLCGQGGAGKSTYGKWLEKELNNTILIRVDDLIIPGQPFDKKYVDKYINNIIKAINSNYSNIIMDFAHDNATNRANILNKIISQINTQDIDFITISLRPGAETVVDWTIKRYRLGNFPKEELIKLIGEERINRVKNIYNNFQYPTIEEFEKYNFNSIQNYVIDNSKPYERLFW